MFLCARAGGVLQLCLGARAGPVFVFDARASYSPLERVIRISVGNWVILITFSTLTLSLTFQKPILRASLTIFHLLSKVDLVLVCF